MDRLTPEQIARKHDLAEQLAERRDALEMSVAAYNLSVCTRHASVRDACEKLNETLEKIDRFAAEVGDLIDRGRPGWRGDAEAYGRWLAEWWLLEADPVAVPGGPGEIDAPESLSPADLRELPDAPGGAAP